MQMQFHEDAFKCLGRLDMYNEVKIRFKGKVELHVSTIYSEMGNYFSLITTGKSFRVVIDVMQWAAGTCCRKSI